jgi:hypothetical protein
MGLYRGYARDYGVIPMAEGFDVFKALTSEASGGASEEH